MIPSVTNRGNEQALDTWATHCAAGGVAGSTITLYRYYLSRFLSGRAVYAVDVEDCERWLAGHDWSACTHRSVVSSLRDYFDWLGSDAAAGLQSPPEIAAGASAVSEADPTRRLGPRPRDYYGQASSAG